MGRHAAGFRREMARSHGNQTRAKCMRRVEAFHFRNVRTETEEAEQGLIRSDDDDDDWLLSGYLNCHLVMILMHPEFDLKSMNNIIILK